MNEKHQDNLKMYVNDVIGMERDILNAIESQLEDERVTANIGPASALRSVVTGSKTRMQRLKEISSQEGGSIGAGIKEAAMSVTGAVAGIYDKLREHPVSRMLRDDIVALNVASVSYTMLYTLARGAGHAAVAEIARNGMAATPPLIMELTRMLPDVILGELSDEAPLADAGAAKAVQEAIHEVWSQSPALH